MNRSGKSKDRHFRIDNESIAASSPVANELTKEKYTVVHFHFLFRFALFCSFISGVGKSHNDAASVRTPYPIPAACGLYYFEVKIISKGRDGYMGIGLTAQNFKSNRLPGWDKQSYGYHGNN